MHVNQGGCAFRNRSGGRVYPRSTAIEILSKVLNATGPLREEAPVPGANDHHRAAHAVDWETLSQHPQHSLFASPDWFHEP